jgi:NMD protein affecting ribosome stability and mRNA decay
MCYIYHCYNCGKEIKYEGLCEDCEREQQEDFYNVMHYMWKRW